VRHYYLPYWPRLSTFPSYSDSTPSPPHSEYPFAGKGPSTNQASAIQVRSRTNFSSICSSCSASAKWRSPIDQRDQREYAYTRKKKKKTERGKRKKRKKKERINPVALSGIYSCARTFVMFADRLRGIVAALGRIHRT